jgi:predicted permease
MRLRSLLRRGAEDRYLDKELRYHLEQQLEENLAQGMSLDEARFAALHALGGVTQIEEECRDMRRTNHVTDCLQDLRYAARALARSPGFAAVIVLTMALAIGANSAIFSVIQGVLLKKLPYEQPDRLVRLYLKSPEFPKFPINPFDFRDYRTRARSFESLAAYTRHDVQLSGSGLPVRLSGFAVTSGFFHVLGLHPIAGREFSTTDELPSNGHVVILSNTLWRTRFGAQSNIVGQKMILDAIAYTVVGVMPPGVEHPGNAYHAVAFGKTVDVWTPFSFEGDPAQRGSHYMDCIGRLKDGVSVAHAEAELNAVMAQLGREHQQDRDWRVMVIPLEREIVGRSERLLMVLLGAVSLVLLIACANAANLLLARATARQREIAIRAALGARKSRLIRQMLTESVLISSTGAIFGAVLAIAGVKVLVSLLPADFPRAADIHVNAAVFLFTLAIALVTGLLFGLAPALQGSKTDLGRPLHEGSRSATSSTGSVRLRNSLVVSEVALACVLLIGAGLMLRSFLNLLHTDPGFRPDHVLTASISLPSARYKTRAVGLRFYHTLLTELAATPGVRAAGGGTDLPWTGYDENAGGFQIEGKKPPPHQDSHARYHAASADYFRALGIPLIRGRFFTQHDNKDAPLALIVNESMARRYWPRENALGARITFEDNPKEKDWMTIVGIVGDVKDTPASSGAEPAFWWPLFQQPWFANDLSIVVRGESDPSLLASQIRAAVASLDPTLAVADVRLMDQIADNSYSTYRFAFFLVGLFAILAATLAAIGTYGVISYSVNQRSHEFGIRMALGAKPRDVVVTVLREGMKLTVAGVIVGVVCGLALGRLLGSLLYGVGVSDPLTLMAACLLAVAASALACYLPARRATRNDPMNALRAD